ncbi:MAG: ABC transporter ATP-binding protein [Desulfobacterales bacterium]|jgi:zinc transport system ATP-binding protein
MENSIVQIQNVWFAYNGKTVLQDVSLDIQPGDFIAMIGPNGGGKTTLLKLILGLLRPDRGSIKVLGGPSEKASHHIGYVPQDVHINRSFPITAIDVVLMGKLGPAKRWTRNATQDRLEALDALERMEIADCANSKINALSGGQRQRVFIARALVAQPKILLLDEPTASIDARGQAEFYRLLKTLNKDITVLVVSHDLVAISTHVKSVACVNKRLHYHDQAEITGEMLEEMYPCIDEEVCPVELVAHGLPHRVLKHHQD